MWLCIISGKLFFGFIWMHISEKSQANATNVTMHFLMQAIWGPILKTHIVEKSNKCNQCDYASSFASHLRTHLKIHNGKKSHKCNQCDYVSYQSGHSRVYLKTHTGEVTHKCNQCDFASSQASSLKVRLKTHRWEKSNKCDQCDFACSDPIFFAETHEKA